MSAQAGTMHLETRIVRGCCVLGWYVVLLASTTPAGMFV
jgi:hypothetical protein